MNVNPAMETANHAEHTKGPGLGVIIRITLRVNPGNIGTASFRAVSRISPLLPFLT